MIVLYYIVSINVFLTEIVVNRERLRLCLRVAECNSCWTLSNYPCVSRYRVYQNKNLNKLVRQGVDTYSFDGLGIGNRDIYVIHSKPLSGVYDSTYICNRSSVPTVLVFSLTLL